jgi:hypothetical protein
MTQETSGNVPGHGHPRGIITDDPEVNRRRIRIMKYMRRHDMSAKHFTATCARHLKLPVDVVGSDIMAILVGNRAAGLPAKAPKALSQAVPAISSTKPLVDQLLAGEIVFEDQL